MLTTGKIELSPFLQKAVEQGEFPLVLAHIASIMQAEESEVELIRPVPTDPVVRIRGEVIGGFIEI